MPETIVLELRKRDIKRLEEKGIDKTKLKELLQEYASKVLLIDVERLKRRGSNAKESKENMC